jgi:hypothetical protein
MLSDSEDSSSCATEEGFFDIEDNITNALQLIDDWQNNMVRKVRFSSASIREYSLTVGDHPICRDGLALSLDWNHAKEKVYDIDDYEYLRRRTTTRKDGRRRTSRLDYFQRREILQRVGSFSNKELSKIERQRNKDAVSEFLKTAARRKEEEEEEDYDSDQNKIGTELLELGPEEHKVAADVIDDESDVELFYDLHGGECSEWQMKVQVLED